MLDHLEHEADPFRPEAIATLERLDSLIRSVRETAERLAPGRAHVAIVSDDGFARVDMQLNLFPAFRKAKLFGVDDKGDDRLAGDEHVHLKWQTHSLLVLVTSSTILGNLR